MDYRTWLTVAVQRLSHSDSPKRDAEILLEFVTGKGRTFLLAFGETLLPDAQQQCLDALLARRVAGEPIAYLIGQREFWSLPLAVSPATLIPRPDTECLVEEALRRIPSVSAPSILDLGTGTGAIALALASERPDSLVIGIDIQPDAVMLARQNGARLRLGNATFLQGTWFAPVVQKRFHMIVSNPPYIDADDVHLHQGDVRFEPSSALIAAEGGLADLREIIAQAPQHLHEHGWLLLEHGWQQGAQVRDLLQQRGFAHVVTCRDYGGNERVSLGQWSAQVAG